MSAPTTAPVLVGTDGSDSALHAVRWAAQVAARQSAPLHIVHAIGIPIDMGPTLDYTLIEGETYRSAAQSTVDDARAAAVDAAAPIRRIEIEISVSDEAPIPLLRDLSADARLLVVGTRGLGALRRGLLGSASTSLARHARCPVAVVPEDPPAEGPVVVGVDGSGCSVRAIEIAFEQAAGRGTDLVAVHTWSEFYRYLSRDDLRQEAESLLSENLAGYCRQYPDLRVHRIVREDRSARAILDAAADTDAQLIVVGSHGRGGFVGMTLGSVSQAVLHSYDRPVIIAREGT
ncbi:universal stress protein [Nocardia brevicatena]|uniref:universal stress protein n=1 Tax=Nocardia brevicatena TaxID=37327 RepID=UPI0002F6B0BD|nr:universal stress protein [Nocardia brevicatena]